MASKFGIPVWKASPFVRLLPPFIGGIIFQWYLKVPFIYICTGLFVFIIAFLIFNFLPLTYRFTLQRLQGLLLHLIFFFFAIFITHGKDKRNDLRWLGNFYSDSCLVILTIKEPPIEKEKSYKADADAKAIITNGIYEKVSGKILIYFSKEDSSSIPLYGQRILVKGGLKKIKNSGNPGSFDYRRYMAFQQTFHQAFLKKSDYVILGGHDESLLSSLIFLCRKNTIDILQHYVKGEKKVTGIAEALLIGYKEDLDKDVVQAYSNTGVVHIIAISGMHLGLIYAVLVWLFSRLPVIKKSSFIRVLLILMCLWVFSFITGASASVLRSATMFTCIIIGKTFFKQASVYNSLAASAFLLLCYDPYLLWDVGFQLSYCAVVGIVWLQKPIVNLFFFKNKYWSAVWEMCAITLAAQVFTFPVCIYYFHQLPTMFLFTNLICVPLSTVILFAEIGLIIISFSSLLAGILGKCVYVLTWLMNTVIDFFDKLPFSSVDMIYATPVTTILLYGFVFCISSALLRKNKTYFKVSLAFLFMFSSLWAWGKITLANQKKLIIYNVSRHTAVDFVAGNRYFFYGDREFYEEGALQNFNLKPARVSVQAEKNHDTLPGLVRRGSLWNFYKKRIMVIDSTVNFEPLSSKIQVDVLLVCKRAGIKIADITNAVNPAVVVLDASNSLWKIEQWKKECEKLHLRCFVTGEQGAFVADAN